MLDANPFFMRLWARLVGVFRKYPAFTTLYLPGVKDTVFYSLFDTALGRCGIAWRKRGICGVFLPERRARALHARLKRRHPGACESSPPPSVQYAIDAIARLLRGERCELATIPLDMTGIPRFHRRVYEYARTIPPGTTLSYGDIAKRLRVPGAARAVGQALARNPFAILVPCHRVLASGGKIGGFTAPGGVRTKQRLLAAEGYIPGHAWDHHKPRGN